MKMADARSSAWPAVEYVVETFILVLNWWVESRRPLLPREVDDLLLAMVLHTLAATADGR
jgi:hypothetical protein